MIEGEGDAGGVGSGEEQGAIGSGGGPERVGGAAASPLTGPGFVTNET